ncbi:TPA: hypothetical protein ACGW6O_006018 [Bacillus cereus]
MSNAGIALVSNGYLLVKRFTSFTRPIKFQCLIVSAEGVDNDEVGRSVR